jgi:hypothetical protein
MMCWVLRRFLAVSNLREYVGKLFDVNRTEEIVVV